MEPKQTHRWHRNNRPVQSPGCLIKYSWISPLCWQSSTGVVISSKVTTSESTYWPPETSLDDEVPDSHSDLPRTPERQASTCSRMFNSSTPLVRKRRKLEPLASQENIHTDRMVGYHVQLQRADGTLYHRPVDDPRPWRDSEVSESTCMTLKCYTDPANILDRALPHLTCRHPQGAKSLDGSWNKCNTCYCGTRWCLNWRIAPILRESKDQDQNWGWS